MSVTEFIFRKVYYSNSFITLKDRNENFTNHPTAKLINPPKSEIGRISKHILDQINTELVN